MNMDELIKTFGSIRLDQMDEVMLMNRIDRKFCINLAALPELLEKISDSYYCLEIDDRRVFTYTNTYYDSQANEMYNDHLRGKMNRYKIRVRNYDVSNISFLEVKFKNNRGKTYKSRIKCNGEASLTSGPLAEFLKEKTPFSPENLKAVMGNRFRRITLVSKALNERCTIDFDISFNINQKEHKLDRLAIVEIKTDGLAKATPILSALREMHGTTNGFSNYCFGRSVLEPTLKNNRYKPKIRNIDKLQTINQ